jgi:hypothetical protein
MKYYLNPLPPIDTVHEHFGILISFFAISIFFLIGCLFIDVKIFVKIAHVGLVMFLISVVVSFTTGEITERPNVQVRASFLQFVPEVSKKGNHEYHVIYGEFETPDGNVILTIPEGFPINKTQTLYKN